MIYATISEVKNRLSAYLRRVRAGETVMIMDRKTPVASLVPVSDDLARGDARVERLAAAGLIEQGTRTPAIADLTPLALGREVDVVQVLLEERRSRR